MAQLKKKLFSLCPWELIIVHEIGPVKTSIHSVLENPYVAMYLSPIQRAIHLLSSYEPVSVLKLLAEQFTKWLDIHVLSF